MDAAPGLASELRDTIARGHYRPGALLPDAADLAAERGVTYEAVIVAYRMLFEAGLVDEVRDDRAVVRAPRRVDLSCGDQMYRDAHGYYHGAAARGWTLLEHYGVYRDRADIDTADLLHVAVGSDVVVRARLVGDDGPRRPMQISTTVIPGWVAAELPIVAQADTGPGGIADRLEQHYGALAWHGYVAAGLATGETARRLDIPEGAAVLYHSMVSLLADGRPAEVTVRATRGTGCVWARSTCDGMSPPRFPSRRCPAPPSNHTSSGQHPMRASTRFAGAGVVVLSTVTHVCPARTTTMPARSAVRGEKRPGVPSAPMGRPYRVEQSLTSSHGQSSG